MAKRIVDIYYNITDNVLQDSTGYAIDDTKYPIIFYKENPLYRVRIVIDSVNTAYTELDSSMTFSASIDNDYNSATNLMVKTLNADINVAGDWVGGGNADITQGQLSIRLDANTAEFAGKLGTNKQIDANLEILGFNLSSVKEFSVSFPVIAINEQDLSGSAPPATPSNYYTKVEADALYLGKQDVNNQTVITTATTLTQKTGRQVIFVNGTFNLTLFPATVQAELLIVNVGVGTVTIIPAGVETINGVVGNIITSIQYGAYRLISYANNWISPDVVLP